MILKPRTSTFFLFLCCSMVICTEVSFSNFLCRRFTETCHCSQKCNKTSLCFRIVCYWVMSVQDPLLALNARTTPRTGLGKNWILHWHYSVRDYYMEGLWYEVNSILLLIFWWQHIPGVQIVNQCGYWFVEGWYCCIILQQCNIRSPWLKAYPRSIKFHLELQILSGSIIFELIVRIIITQFT